MESGASMLPLGLLALPAPALDNTYGIIMVGTFIGLFLYGVTLHQVYRYVHLPAYKADTLYTKSMVVIVLILETWHSLLSAHSVYFYVSKNYFNPSVLFHGVWSINLIPMATGVITSVSQSFFARRLWMIERKFRPLVVIIVILLVGETGLCTAITVEAFIQPTLLQFESSTRWMLNTALGMAVAADLMIATLLTIVLRRSRTGFERTDCMLNTLIVYTINTGLLTGTVSTVSLLLSVASPDTLLGNGVIIGVAKLYAISLLAVLNSRDFLKKLEAKGASNCSAGSGSGRQPAIGVYGSRDRLTAMKANPARGDIELKLARDFVHSQSSHSGDGLRGGGYYELDPVLISV